MMEELAQTRQQYTTQRDLCAAQLQELHEEQARYETEQSQMPHPSQVDYAALQVQLSLCQSHKLLSPLIIAQIALS